MERDDLQAVLAELRAVVAQQGQDLRAVRARLEELETDGIDDIDGSEGFDNPLDAPTSRRRMLALAGAAAAGAVGVVATGSRQAAAANGASINIAATTSASAASVTPTIVDYSLTSGPGDYFVVTDLAPASTPTLGTVLGAFNSAGPNNLAVHGRTTRPTATGVLGEATGSGSTGVSGVASGPAGVGVRGDGGPSGYALFAAGLGRIGFAATSPLGPVAGTYAFRDVVGDLAGNLYANVAAGTPGVFRKLSGPATAGQLHVISPVRVYDSRVASPTPGALAAGANRTISVADGRDLATGTVTTANVVPVGATAVACNITVVNTEGPAGFLAVNPGGNPVVAASSINWFTPGQIAANGIIAALGGDRQLTIIAGGSAGTDFALDITGYYL